jgi:beta-lactamase class A
MWQVSLAGLDEYRASRAGTTEIAIADLSSGVVHSLGDQGPLRAASIIKVTVALAALRDAERNLRELTESERAALDAAIRTSDNDATTDLWNSSGGAAGLVETAAAAGLQTTSPDPHGAWGFTLTSAHDQAQLLLSLYWGRLANASHTEFLIGLMRGVVPQQRWGLAAGAPPTWQPAIKNGWYPDTDEPVWRVHCLAIFDDVTLARPFAAVVLTRYPQELGIEYGQQTCEDVAARLTSSNAATSTIGVP